MATANSLQNVQENGSFSTFCQSPAIKKRIEEMMTGEEGKRFIASLVSAVATNPNLKKCDPATVITAALVGQGLKLPYSNSLGLYYIVPFEDNNNKRTVAQFQLGYRGYIQLAIRSGFYKKLNVCELREGELKKFNPMTEEIVVELEPNEEARLKLPVTHYYAMFEYVNGFQKVLLWSKSKMEAHARQYSKAFQRDIRKGTQYSFWSRDFNAMAFKTMIRQLLSKWGILSVDLQNAFENDKNDEVQNDNPKIPDIIPAEVVSEEEKTNNEEAKENTSHIDKEEVSENISDNDIEQEFFN